MKEFKINEKLTLKLEKNKTVIYVDGESFKQCKYLMLNIPVDEITQVNNLKSIDEVSEKLSHDLEPSDGLMRVNKIPPEIEFWGHCSNLQVWYENNYDTKLLHSNLSFPLLKKLTEAGDLLAKKVFKEEIAKRYNTGVESVRTYLKNGEYLNYLTKEEFYTLLDTEYDIIKELVVLTDSDRLKIDIKNGKVIGITHHGLKLEQVPNPIRRLTSLKKLDLSINLIKEIPEWIGELQSLKELNFNTNKLIRLPNSMGNLKMLEILEVYNNNLKELPDSIGRLRLLRRLSLFNNQIQRLPPEIGDLESLEELKVYENRLEELPETIGNLKKLNALNLKKNILRTIPATMGNLTSLEVLILDENNLSELPDETGKLYLLELLSISNNKFNKLPKSFETLTSLKRIFFDGNPFKGIPGFVYKLPNLRLISIRNTNINKSGIMKKSFKKKDVEIYK